ncbi:MAG: asparagine synthase-related protein, partial [Acidimicrobiales bacterium]
MTAAFTPHRRQFFIGPDQRPPVPGWSSRKLSGDRYLHHCPTLPVTDDGGQIVMGPALRGGRDDPDGWGGRYVTIDGESLTTDTSSLLGVYTTAGEHGPVFSNSPSLMAAHSGASPVARRLAWYSLNWHPLPGSGRVGTTKLLPATSVDVTSGEQTLAPLPTPMEGSIDDRAAVLADSLTTQLESLADRPTVWVALTAGLDSRTVLAAALHSGCRVRTYTQRFPSLSDTELAVARAVADAADVDHQIVELGRSSGAVRRDIGRHTDGETVDADRYALARHGLGFAGPDEPILRGGVFEYGRRFFA